ncbi:hypothetical protein METBISCDRAFT_22073 [Metschnikowia bicuspidata]|uniref:Uncharacterized protein n=1 Tax=Metschnikowia bicuspidata TaxID=27322 RepID=A0A4V1J3E7_9ASCO|nr:hypothetical protein METBISCDRAFT_22073 [Metschnikowia bicuspidata]
MIIKEPFFVDDATRKLYWTCTAEAFKISPFEEVQPKAILPPVHVPIRKPSVEVYCGMNKRPVFISALSSYARLSDIFDYHYLPCELVDEHAAVSDSDSEPEEVGGDVVTPGYAVGKACFRRFTAESQARLGGNEEKLHFLTFKHNSRATCAPIKADFSNASDRFGELDTPCVSDVLCVATRLRLAPPKCTIKPVDLLDAPFSVQLADYLAKCANPIGSFNSRQCTAAPTLGSRLKMWLATSDCFAGAPTQPSILGDYVPPPSFLV